MVGQQMITEARLRNRNARSISIAHPHPQARHGQPTAAALIYAFMKPLSSLGTAILAKLRLSD